MDALSKSSRALSWALRLTVAAILGQTLYFKFTGAPETRALFDVLGAEPYGRLGAGVGELAAAILVLTPRTVVFGAAASLGVISGAILAHLTKLGISIDPQALGHPELEPLAGPSLFLLAVVVFLGSAGVLWIHRDAARAVLTNPIASLKGAVRGR